MDFWLGVTESRLFSGNLSGILSLRQAVLGIKMEV